MCSGGSGALDSSGIGVQERGTLDGNLRRLREIFTFSAAAAQPSEPLAPAAQGPPGTRCCRNLEEKERAPGGWTHSMLHSHPDPSSHTHQSPSAACRSLAAWESRSSGGAWSAAGEEGTTASRDPASNKAGGAPAPVEASSAGGGGALD